MKIDPPDKFKIPENSEPSRPDEVRGATGSEHAGKIERTAQKAGAAGKSAISRTSMLRELLGDLDLKNPDELDRATDRIVDWVLSDSFGADVAKAKGAESLRAAIREQLLNDPNEAARLKSILDRL